MYIILSYDNLIARKNFFKKNEPKQKMKRLTNEKEKESCKMRKGEFTKLIEENKLKFYKTAKVILKNDVEKNMKIAQYDKYEVDEYGIKDAMKYLNEDLKLITILYYYDNYSVKEISQIINIPEGTVKSRLSKAREILKQKLEKEGI